MRTLTAIVAVSLCFAVPVSARPSRHIHEFIDPYTRLRVLELDIATSPCPGAPGTPVMDVRLRLVAAEVQPHTVTYTLLTDLAFGPILHPGRDGSLDTLTDGASVQLLPSGPKNQWKERNPYTRGRHIREMVPFEAPAEFLRTVAAADTFQFRLNAQDGSVERCVSAKQLRDVREFVDYAATY